MTRPCDRLRRSRLSLQVSEKKRLRFSFLDENLLSPVMSNKLNDYFLIWSDLVEVKTKKKSKFPGASWRWEPISVKTRTNFFYFCFEDENTVAVQSSCVNCVFSFIQNYRTRKIERSRQWLFFTVALIIYAVVQLITIPIHKHSRVENKVVFFL